MICKSRAIALTVLVLCATSGTVAGAEPNSAVGSAGAVEKARAHFDRGIELYKLASYEDAVAEFEAAYALQPHPVIFFNLGQCYEKLGRLTAAITSYRSYLDALPNAPDRERVTAVIQNLKERLSRAAQPLTVNSAPAGATVELDGQARGVTPWLSELAPGTYQLELSLEGHRPISRAVTTSGEQPTVVDVILTPLPSPADRAFFSSRPWTWATLGAAALATGAGAVYGLAARRDSASLTGGLHTREGEAQRLFSSALRNAQRANLLYGIGGLLGLAGGTLFFVEGSF